LISILAFRGSFKELATENNAGEFINEFSSFFIHGSPPFELNVRLFVLGSAYLRVLVIDESSLGGSFHDPLYGAQKA
jgi:hypothetical protein